MKIKEIRIKNYRSIKEQTVDNIQNALILIGKNNAGKSAILNAIRTFWGDLSCEISDFYKGKSEMEIRIIFEITDVYLEGFMLDNKIGISKIPSSAAEFNLAREGTVWEAKTYTQFKEERDQFLESVIKSNVEDYLLLWMKVVKNRCKISDNILDVTAKANTSDCKLKYCFESDDVKDAVNLLPVIAYIGDERKFEDEQNAKSKTLTSNIFNNVIINQLYDKKILSCKDCTNNECTTLCIDEIKRKSVEQLNINELEKLINYKTRETSKNITDVLTSKFQNNYRSDYKVNLKASSSVNKSYDVTTKIYDPMLKEEIELANVGAGIRSIYILSLLQSYRELMGGDCIFIIEEPELYLHPELQKEMAKTLWDLSENNQVFFTTHSPIMLKNFKIQEVRNVKLDMASYETKIESVQLQIILEEIGYSSQDILNTDFILFVEGPDDKTTLKKIIERFYNLDLNKVTIIDTKSCQNIETYATLRFLDKTTLRTEFAIMRDADTMLQTSLRQKVVNQMKENIATDYVSIIESRIHITKYSSIEGYFMDWDYIIQNRIFTDEEKLIENLKHHLNENSQKHKNYFEEKNKKYLDRIEDYGAVYQNNFDNPKENFEWLKANIRGHDLFGYLNAKKIGIEKFVSDLPEEKFIDILNFLDGIPYFENKRLGD